MIKLIESSQFDDVPGIGAKFAEYGSRAMSKEAESIFGVGYDALRPTDSGKYVGIHLTALGDEETYGPNRNFDSFPKEACVRYHDTFVKHGHVFSHHNNDASKDPILGCIKASAYNDKMHRIELFIWADREKAKEGLDQLEKQGEASFSMACRVPWDECSICGRHRRNSRDPAECDHIRYGLGKVAEDGKVAFMRNVEPDFFDISFVTRPADRIAYSLKVAAESPDHVTTSEELAATAGIVVPEFARPGLVADKHAAARSLADAYDAAERDVVRGSDMFGKVAAESAARLDDATLETLRGMPVKQAMAFLADNCVVLDPLSFCKYAMGADSAECADVAPHAGIVGRLAAQAIKEAAWSARFDVTSPGVFDVDGLTARPSRRFTDVARADAVLKRASLSDANIPDLVVGSVCTVSEKSAACTVDADSNICFTTVERPILATALKYAEYKVSALTAIHGAGRAGWPVNTNRESLVALVAAQDIH